MAVQINNDKGFLIIKTSREEILSLNPNNLGICDSCNQPGPDSGYYISVLNSWYCPGCYERWYTSAERFPEDIQYEEMKFKPVYHLLIAQGN